MPAPQPATGLRQLPRHAPARCRHLPTTQPGPSYAAGHGRQRRPPSRRAAEKAARDLINTPAALIGGLGVAAARHATPPLASPTPNTTPKHSSTKPGAAAPSSSTTPRALSTTPPRHAPPPTAPPPQPAGPPPNSTSSASPPPRPAGAPAQPTSPPAPPIPACEASAATTRQAPRQTPQRRSSSAPPPSPRATAQHRRQHCRGSSAGYQSIRAACGGTPPPTSPRSVRTRPSTGKGTPRSFPTAAREASVRTHPCPRSLYGHPGRPHGDGHSTRRPTGPGAS